MATDITTLRAELKSFERDFKSRNGHDPSIDDIRKAGLADRYKLYKKLQKEERSRSIPTQPSASTSRSGARPSTPPSSRPRTHEAPSSIVPKSRAVRTEIIASSNPFSPVKKKGKQKQVARGNDEAPLPNPFATPVKGKSKGNTNHRPSSRPLSPDPFPPIENPQFLAPSQQQAGPSNPVSRARKRLRGEPVSPSPVKEKKQRVASQATLPFPNLSSLTAPDSDDDDHPDVEHANSSFVADSPVKAPPKGGAFKVLFEEDASAQSNVQVIARPNFGRSKSSRGNNGPFRSSAKRARSTSMSSDDMTAVDNHNGSGIGALENGKPAIRKRTHVNGFSFGKNNLFDTTEEELSQAAQSARPGPNEHSSGLNTGHSVGKRSLPADAEPETALPLLPPSPPPAGTSTSKKWKGKVTFTSRKKPKLIAGLDDEDEVDDESSEETQVKVREWSWQRHGRGGGGGAQDLGSDDDGLALSADPRSRELSTPGPASDDAPGAFDVNLPENLQRILALSPSKVRDPNDEELVHGLLYGHRAGHYDAEKGGDIWDIGEIGDGTEGEEDWEGEPVPWEAGEL